MKIPFELKLPPFPVSVIQLLGLLDNPRAQTNQIAGVLRHDPSLTATTLRMANSSYYRRGEPVLDLDAAVRRLGTATLLDLVAASWFAARLPDVIPFYCERADDLWRHSVATGVLAQKLAAECAMSPGIAFTGGLLHDIGKVVLATAPKTHHLTLELLEGESPTAAERRLLGTAHDELGGQLAKNWRLPQALAESIRWHHHPGGATTAECKKLATLVDFSSTLARTFGFGADAIDLQRPFGDGTELLGLTAAQTERIVVESLEPIEALVDVVRPCAA